MRKILIIFIFLTGFSCNPYQPYYYTHYHISAEYDPATTHLSANVRMVLVLAQEHRDSLILQLNEHLKIRSLAAQELEYYEFDGGRLVIYIEKAVMPGDQLHISLAYDGLIGSGTGQNGGLTTGICWYPICREIDKMTYTVELDLPEIYELEEPGIRKGRSWHLGSAIPLDSISVPEMTFVPR